MPREVPRARRIAEQVQRVLSQLLLREVRDPRLKPMTITHVKVSPDLTHVWVLYTLLSGATRTTSCSRRSSTRPPCTCAVRSAVRCGCGSRRSCTSRMTRNSSAATASTT